jgi:hypothetical protein
LAGLLITGIVSGTTLWVTSLQKDKELEIQRLKNDSELHTTRGELIFKNIHLLTSADSDEKQFAVAAMVWTLGRDEADRLLASIQQFGPTEVQSFVKSARGEIQTANLTRDARLKDWAGRWLHTFTSTTFGSYSGEMVLQVGDAGIVSGTFQAKNKTITGSLYEGTLSEDGTLLTGRWRNSAGKGQEGRFFFELSSDGKASHFAGSYSMYDTPVQKGSSNTWSGVKIKGADAN